MSQDYCSASGYTCCVETQYAYSGMVCLVHKSDLYVKIKLGLTFLRKKKNKCCGDLLIKENNLYCNCPTLAGKSLSQRIGRGLPKIL